MNVTQLLLRAIETGSPDDRVRFMAEVGRLIARQVRASDMWEVENSPRYFGFEGEGHQRWSDIYPSGFEDNLGHYAGAEPTIDFFLGSPEQGPQAQQAAPVTQQPPSRFEQAFAADGRLGAMARRGDDIGGYLATMVRNYLHDRQKKNDPFGYRAFKNLEAVIEALEGDKVLIVTGRVGRKERIRRSSLVRFRTASAGGGAPASVVGAVLAAPALTGNAHKLAKLGRGAQRLLRPVVEGLPAAGVGEFQFGELLTPLQEQVRDAARVWFGGPPSAQQTLEAAEANNLAENRIAVPSERYATLEHVEALTNRVRDAIDRSTYQERTRHGLRRVFDDWIDYVNETQSLEHPPYAQWAIRLGVPSSTIENHVQKLKVIISQVGAESGGAGL